MTGDENGMWLCEWNEAADAYARVANIAIPGRGESECVGQRDREAI